MSEITPEKVARYLAIGHRGAVGHGGRYVVSGYEGRVVHAEVVEESERRQFRAVVFEGETVPDLAELDRLRRGMRDLYARWIQRARDNGDYYNRTAEKYENGKAVAFDAAAEEIRLLMGESAQAQTGGAQ
jgi:hypothetical protein